MNFRCQELLNALSNGLEHSPERRDKESVKSAPYEVTLEIVRRVQGLFALADQLEERLAKARGQVDQLTPSLLARAFAALPE